MKLLIDYGGTYIRYELNGSYKKIESKNINIVQFIEDKIKQFPIKTVGISFAGQVDDGIMRSAPNIAVPKNFNIKKYFKELYGIDVFIENDLKCAAVAESIYFKCNYIATVYVGTGIGAGFVEKKLIRGYKNLAGELGHIPYKETRFTCGCGKNNCLELTCSGKALSIRNLKNISDDENFRLEFNNALNYAIEVVSILLNPKIIVLGGGVIEHNRVKIEPKLPNFTDVELEISRIKDAPMEGLKFLMKDGAEDERR